MSTWHFSARLDTVFPGNLDYLFLIRKKFGFPCAGGHLLLFIIEENTPNQTVYYY